MENPVRLLVIAFILLVVGAAVPFLMVFDVLPKNLGASFGAYACSIAGVVAGFLGIASYRRRQK